MSTKSFIPRIVIAGTGSGVGKTTTVLGLIQALKDRGLKVASFKCGPDYLDPTYHARASGQTCHNLDSWMMGKSALISTFENAAKDSDIAIIEGVMGLFDSLSPISDDGSTAQIAKWLNAPVLLVVDAKGMARTIAAFAHGFKTYDPECDVKGIIANFVGSESHLKILREALGDFPLVGGFPKEINEAFPDRHLGLMEASKKNVPEERFKFWGELTKKLFQLDEILKIAQSSPSLPPAEIESKKTIPLTCRVAVAKDEAFSFYYEDNLRRLRFLGAELIFFSPLHDKELPKADGLYIGGGYPEVFAAKLSDNHSMRESILTFVNKGGPLYAECGGFMYLTDSIIQLNGEEHSMLGLVSGKVRMKDKLAALGYVEVVTSEDTILGPAGLRFRGHQFRYSEFIASSEGHKTPYMLHRRRVKDVLPEGSMTQNILGSYVHAHWASNPTVASGFVKSCVRFHELAF